MKTMWYALRDTGDVVPLGEHDDFESADAACQGFNAVWIFEQETANEWAFAMYPKLGALIECAEALSSVAWHLDARLIACPDEHAQEALDAARAALAKLQESKS